MSNGKTYTEVLLDVYDKLDNVEQRILRRMDVIAIDNTDCKERMAKGDARFKAIDDKIVTACVALEKGIDENASAIGKVRNLNTFIALLGSTIAGIIGTQK